MQLTNPVPPGTYVPATMAPVPSVLGGGVDVAALQALADQIETAGGGELRLLPNSTYQMNTTLFLGSKTTLRGSGWNSVLKAIGTAHAAVYNKGWTDTANGNVDITVSDLTVDGNGINTTGIVFAGVLRGSIHNVRTKGMTGYNVWLWAAGEGAGTLGLPTRQVTVSDCHMSAVLDVGIEMDASQQCTVVGNTIESAGCFAGIYAWNGAQDCTITGNVVVGTGSTPAVIGYRVYGLDNTTVRQTARITFTGNVAYNVQTGFYCQGVSGDLPTDITFTGNSLQSWALTSGQGGFGVHAVYSTRLKVTNNHIEGFYKPFAFADASAGDTAGTVTQLTCDDNRIYTCGTGVAYQVPSGSFSRNMFVGSTNVPMKFFACTNLTVVNNQGIDCCDATSGGQALFEFQDYSAGACNANTISFNRTSDSRGSKFMKGAVLLAGNADYNVCVGNNSRGAAGASRSVQNTGAGVHNIIFGNMNDGAPAVTTGAQATSAAFTAQGASDTAQSVTVTTIAGPAAGALFTVTFTGSIGATPRVLLTPLSGPAAACQPYVSAKSATAFTVSCAAVPAASTALLFDLAVIT